MQTWDRITAGFVESVVTVRRISYEENLEGQFSMVNASLNWASIFGIILFFWATFIALAVVEVLSRGEKSNLI